MFSELMRETFRNPRGAAAMLAGLNLPGRTAWMALAASLAISVLVTEPMFRLAPPDTFGEPIAPLMRFLVTIPFTGALVWAIWKIASIMGGTADLAQVIVVFSWLELLLSLGLLAMLVLLFVLPPLAGLLGLGAIMAWIWLQSVFFAQIFGFATPAKAFAVVVMAWVAVYVFGILILSIVAGGGQG